MKIGKRSATLLAIAFALLMAIPIGGMMTAQAATPTELVQVYSENPAVINAMKAAGAEIFVDYHNGMYLLKVDKTAENMMTNEGISFEKASSAGSLSMYPAKYRFNPAVSMPAIPDNLKATPTKGETGLYIVQFVGPIASSDWTKSIESAGGRVIKNIPNNALLVKMTPETADTVKNMAVVAWVGTYEPAYKISPGVNINTSDSQWVRITTTLGDNPNDLANYLKDKGISVSKVTRNNLGRGTVIAVIPGNVIPSIAAMNTVDTITKFTPAVPLDLVAAKIIGLPGVWYPSKSGQSERYIGLNQVIGLQDTGYDEGDASAGPNDHFQGPLGDRVKRFTDQGGSSVPDGNTAVNGENVAHGSHCAGLLSGNGWSWEKSPYEGTYDTTDYNWDHAQSVGSAPGALLSLDGCTAYSAHTGGSLAVDPKYWSNENSDGAYLFSNSWGSTGTDYGGSATNADDDMDSNNAWLIFFAASNDGPNLNTLDPEGCEKDGLVIGASENYRPDWFGGDNPNLMADFSSRGGPAQGDSRLKPDVVAPGTADISLNARGEYTQEMSSQGGDANWIPEVDEYDWNNKAPGHDGAPDYQYMQGTSMATPVATGAAAVIRQYLNDTIYHDNSAIPGYLIKALMINGAERMNSQLYTYPGYAQGWGRINVKNSILPNPPVSIQHEEHSFTSTGSWTPSTINLDVASSDYPLKFTLAWVDTSGVSLSRDLDLQVTDPSGNVYKGNAYQNGWSVPNADVSVTDSWLGSSWDKSNGYDGVNTVEQVEVEHPVVGTWQVSVDGANIPSTTNCALVVRGDIGSQEPAYGVNLNSPIIPTIKVDQGGTATFPVDINNAGKNADTFDLSNDAPSGLTIDYTYGGNSISSYAIEPKKTVRTVMKISASSTLAAGTYQFTLTATSQNDTTRKGYIDMTVEVVDQSIAVARSVVVADESVDETDPSVTAFTDSSGTPWVFVVYKKLTPTYGGGIYGGTILEVKYAQLNSNGMPGTWHGPIALTNLNEVPNDPRILVAKGGNYNDRVYVVWTGYDPNATNDNTGGSMGSWGRYAYADNSDYSSWTCPATGTNTTIDENSGSGTYNSKRVNSLQYRPSNSELVYIYEHLDADSNGQLTAVHDAYTSSTDGGATWSSPSDIDPGASDSNYYFFPNIMDGGLDNNEVVWMYNYHRPSNDQTSRNLTCMVYDGSWGADTGGASQETEVLGNLHNLQFPVVAYDKSSGSANDVFFAVMNDTSGNFQINVGYHSGSASSSSPPTDSNNAWGTVKGPFATAVSDANYDRRPIMNMISTPDDSGMWVQYIEKSTSLGANIMALYSSDKFSTVNYYYITMNSYGKSHEMSSETKIGSTDYVYTTYHMTKGDLTDVNYNIYLAIYHNGFENDPDTQGPAVMRETAEPTDYNTTTGEYDLNLTANPSFELTATANDLDNGRSTISSAEWLESTTSVTDPTTLDWSSATSMSLTGSTVVETASAMITPSWSTVGEVHRIWIKATDSSGQADYSYIDINVTSIPSGEITVNVANGWDMVSFPWMNTPTSITDALNGLSWDRAMVYDNQNKVWYTYNTARDAKYNLGFPTVDNTKGIWVHTTSAGSEKGPDTDLGTTNVSLYKGWNLVGYPSNTVTTVSSALSGVSYDYVQTYNTTTGQIQTLADTDNMEPGRAYWIHVTADATWSVSW